MFILNILDSMSTEKNTIKSQMRCAESRLEGANNYSNCQSLFRNFYKVEEGTYVNSSPYSRAGLNLSLIHI